MKSLIRKLLRENLMPDMVKVLTTLKPDFCRAAQEVYDQWEQDEDGNDEEYGGGGICDDIADAMCNVIHNKTNYNCFSFYNEYDYHTSIHVYDIGQKLIFNVDIPPHFYETGAGYTWKKKPNIRFSPSMVVINPEDWGDYFDENDELVALNENSTKDGNFNYRGYECRIPFMERFNSYGCFIYKDGEYKLGMRGPVGPLEKATAIAKESVDRLSLTEHKNIAGELIKPNRFVYHQSSIKNRNTILNNGLIKQVGDCYFLYSKNSTIKTKEDCIPAIFVTNSDNKNDWYTDENDYDVWRIDTSGLKNKWYIDNHYAVNGFFKNLVTFDNIPRTSIELIHNGTE